MHRSLGLVVLLGLLACWVGNVESKVSKGTLKGHDWLYLDKFAYGYGHNVFQWTIDFKNGYAGAELQMLFYDDQGNNWTKVYDNNKLTCQNKTALSKQPEPIGNGKQGTVIIEDIRSPHFWYFAVAACGQNTTIDLEYEVTMLQDSNSKWVRQFSYDEQGLEALYLFYFLVFVIGAAVHGYTVWSFLQTDSYHTIVRLFTFSIALEGVSVFCLFVHYAVYADNGIGAPGLKGIGDLLDMTAQIVFMLLVILIAKGWCISKTAIDGRIAILVGLGFVIVSYLGMFIWVNVGLNPASTLYVYQTTPGIIIIVVRCLALLFFLWSIFNTYREENDDHKRRFYFYFFIIYTIWFLSLPIVTLIATGMKEHAVLRQKVVMILYVTFNAIFLFVLGFLLWPTRAYHYFQISARNVDTMPYEAI